MVKAKTKKRLIVIGTLILLVSVYKFYSKVNHNYLLATKLNMPVQAQNSFWNNDVHDLETEIHGEDEYHGYGLDGFGDNKTKSFVLDLDDQWNATYSYSYSSWFDDDKNVVEISVGKKNNNIDKDQDFSFFVNKGNLQIIKDDSKYRMKGSNSPEERRKLDEQTTPDDIIDTDKLEKLAIQRFKEAQDKYYDSKK